MSSDPGSFPMLVATCYSTNIASITRRRDELDGALWNSSKTPLPGTLSQPRGSGRPPQAHHPRQEGYRAGTAARSAHTRAGRCTADVCLLRGRGMPRPG